MSTIRLNEHDANQGAQSKGEFLGMTGNSAWYLLGSVGASLAIVIVLWGILGFSLVLCLSIGMALCLLSLAYVFVLKNNKPAHYDTDFFETALIESGVLPLAFGPRKRLPANPFLREADAVPLSGNLAKSVPARSRHAAPSNAVGGAVAASPRPSAPSDEDAKKKEDKDSTVPLADFERVRAELAATEEMLADAVAGREEEESCE